MGIFKLKAASTFLVAAALLASGPVLAQSGSIESADAPAPAPTAGAAEAPAAGGAQLQEVTVSASAITISGYQQPTPVTSLGIAQLQSAAQPDLSDAVRSLPAFAASSSPQNSNESNNISNGAAGLDQLNLRNLGPNRTLLLIDGQRVVNGTIYGGAETSNIPSTLVERVDVVTGGASAIWGSDAVAGVVNYVLNHNFNGLQIDIQDSNNNQNEHEQYSGTITAGTGFDDNRGHIEGAVGLWRVPDVYYSWQQQGFAFQRLVNNPNCIGGPGGADPFVNAPCAPGQPSLIHATNVGISSATTGGLIVGCVGGVACPMTNTYFVGPNATQLTFNPGNVSSDFYANGGTNNAGAQGYGEVQGVPQTTDTAFLLGSFKFNDHVEATAQFNFGYTSFYENSYTDIQYGATNPAIIYSGNPYIPANIESEMGANGINALQIGTTNTNPFTGAYPSLQAQVNSVGMIVLFESRRLMRTVLGLDGDFGNPNWTWNVDYERSETHQFETGLNNNISQYLLNAENSVTVGNYGALVGCPAGATFCTQGTGTPYTAANFPNPLGLTPGTAACVSNLLSRSSPGFTSNCSPLNIFGSGPGVASPQAIAYVNSVARAGGNADHTNLVENVASAKVQGKLPFGAPAGPVALAAGVVYRSEFGIQVNCGVNCSDVNFPYGNYANFLGNYNVKEGSFELNAPLLKDQWVKDLSVDAAYRAIEYSTSGFVQTYKFGVVSQLTDAVRFRASYSRDIRAGDMYELFGQPQPIGQDNIDPRTGLSVPSYVVSEGNINVKPENAETRTAGFVVTPFQGFIASLDWYYIRISNVIDEGLPPSEIGELCLQGQTSYCNDFIYGHSLNGCRGLTCPLSEQLYGVVSQAVNSDWETETGFDFLADYRMPFMAGALDFNTNENYVSSLDYESVGSTCDPENGVSYDQGSYPACIPQGVPKFRGTVAVTYSQGGWLGTVQARMIGAAHEVSNWTSGVQVDDNDISFQTYVDLRASYRFDNGIQLYGAMDNAFDRLAPVVPSSTFSWVTLYESPFQDYLYDGYGRVWRLGFRYKL